MIVFTLYGIVWLALQIVLSSEDLEQKFLKEKKENFSYSLYKEICQKTVQLAFFSILLPLVTSSIFGVGQSIGLTSTVVARERNVTSFVKTLFIKTFPNTDNSLLFETLLQAAPEEILEKIFELFYNQNQNFEKEKVKEFFVACCKVQQEGTNLIPNFNIAPVSSLFFPQQQFLQTFNKNLLNRYHEKIEKLELIHKILQTFLFIKPYLQEFYSTPFQRVLAFLKKTPISLSISPKKFLFSYIEMERKIKQFP
jgi:hypothetical protein